MKRVNFKTNEAAANQSGAMEARNHFKKGASPKSHTSRRKIIIFGLIVVTMSVTVNAQQRKVGAGFYGAIAFPLDRSGVYTINRQTFEYKSEFLNYGIGGKLQYNVTEPIRVEGSFGYFLGMTEMKELTKSGWNDANIFSSSKDFSVNAHYRFDIGNLEKIYVYPLVGVTFLKATDRLLANYHKSLIPVHIDEKIRKRSGAGLNIGCGYEIKIKERIRTFSEMKFSIISDGLNRVTWSGGLVFLF